MPQILHHHDLSAEERLRSYLDALEQPLAGLGEVIRSDWRSEAECHLRSLIAAHEELGSTHEEAVTAALARFSVTPKRTGWQVRLAALRSVPDTSVIQLVARVVAQAFLVAGVSFAVLGSAAIWYVASDAPAAATVLHVVSLTGFLLTPMICGWRIGQLFVAWQATAGSRAVSTWRRPLTDRFPVSRRMSDLVRDIDMVPWIGIGAVTVAWLVGTMFYVCSTFTGGTTYVPAGSFINGFAWLPMTALFASISLAIRRRDSRSAAPAARIGDGR